jgi:hypothetical protein
VHLLLWRLESGGRVELCVLEARKSPQEVRISRGVSQCWLVEYQGSGSAGGVGVDAPGDYLGGAAGRLELSGVDDFFQQLSRPPPGSLRLLQRPHDGAPCRVGYQRVSALWSKDGRHDLPVAAVGE